MTLYKYALTAVALAACQIAAAQTPAAPANAASAKDTSAAAPSSTSSAPAPAVANPAEADKTPPPAAQADAAASEPRIIRGNDRVIAPGKTAPRFDGAPVSFNFEEAPVAQVVRTILGDTSERTTHHVISALIDKRLLVSGSHKAPLRLGFPIDVVERWFPKLYPAT